MVDSEGIRSGSVRGPARLALLSGLAAPAVIAAGVYAVTGHGLPCPFLALTGWLCPLCGGSRMGAAVLAGDLPAAWAWNPFALLLIIGVALVWLWTAARVITGKSADLPGPFAILDRLRPSTLVWLIAVPAVVFAVIRNIV